jgi:hypothetical protein
MFGSHWFHEATNLAKQPRQAGLLSGVACLKTSVSDPDWIRIQSGQWISAVPISSHTTFPLTWFKTSWHTVIWFQV